MQQVNLSGKTVFVTGAAGFIGANLCRRLLGEIPGIRVIGLDNLNYYYDVRLKEYRLRELEGFENFVFLRGDLADGELLRGVFRDYAPSVVVNLAAQAGVRYSITNPDAYISSNLIGFYNILDCCRHYGVEHLV